MAYTERRVRWLRLLAHCSNILKFISFYFTLVSLVAFSSLALSLFVSRASRKTKTPKKKNEKANTYKHIHIIKFIYSQIHFRAGRQNAFYLSNHIIVFACNCFSVNFPHFWCERTYVVWYNGVLCNRQSQKCEDNKPLTITIKTNFDKHNKNDGVQTFYTPHPYTQKEKE